MIPWHKLGQPSTNSNSLGGVHLNMLISNSLTQVLDRILPKFAFFKLTVQSRVPNTLKDLYQVHSIFLLGLRVNQNIIKMNFDKLIKYFDKS